MDQDNLSNKHNPDWALFLPAVSSFYISGLGKQRKGEEYFDKARIPAGFNNDVEKLNFLNSKEGLYYYKWGLYSAGHANLDTTVNDPSESIIREREQGTFMLGDSGGFQILKCQWPADWKDPNCPRAMKKRKEVLTWMDTYMDYGMCLDIPSQSLTTYHIKDPKTGKSAHGIQYIEDAIKATHINNEYFIQNRSGKCKFLNVLQGRHRAQSDSWYNEMKKYCDPNIYPDNHFNGWAFGGQNKIDVDLMLRRMIDIIYDGLLIPGKHDLIHCLGVSIMEYAVLFTDIQKAIRKYHNPNLQITFDCASPFYGAAKGLAYFNTSIEHNKKWSYSMEKTAEKKSYSNDTRKFSTAVLADGIHDTFTDSPVTDKMLLKDLCYRGVGFLGQHGKETKTSWDTLSYTLVQSHNVWMHINAVQEANRKYEQGIIPKMLMNEQFERILYKDVIEEIFSQKTREDSIKVIERHEKLWMQMQSGSQGISGKKTINALGKFEELFSFEEEEPEVDEVIEDSDDEIAKVLEN
jgi:DNA-binding transcriptional ArsR family regulator